MAVLVFSLGAGCGLVSFIIGIYAYIRSKKDEERWRDHRECTCRGEYCEIHRPAPIPMLMPVSMSHEDFEQLKSRFRSWKVDPQRTMILPGDGMTVTYYDSEETDPTPEQLAKAGEETLSRILHIPTEDFSG